MNDVEIIDNSPQVKSAIKDAILRALETIGLKAERYAKQECPVDTGNLRNSITHVVEDTEEAVYIGTNVQYAPYVELGTGEYATGGGGRQSPWSFQDAQGNWHRTKGQKAQPFLKPAATEHASEYRNILEKELKKG